MLRDDDVVEEEESALVLDRMAVATVRGRKNNNCIIYSFLKDGESSYLECRYRSVFGVDESVDIKMPWTPN